MATYIAAHSNTGHSLPVLIVLCDPATQNCYWEHVAVPNVTHTPKGMEDHSPAS